jgi:hypothetical protein
MLSAVAAATMASSNSASPPPSHLSHPSSLSASAPASSLSNEKMLSYAHNSSLEAYLFNSKLQTLQPPPPPPPLPHSRLLDMETMSNYNRLNGFMTSSQAINDNSFSMMSMPSKMLQSPSSPLSSVSTSVSMNQSNFKLNTSSQSASASGGGGNGACNLSRINSSSSIKAGNSGSACNLNSPPTGGMHSATAAAIASSIVAAAASNLVTQANAMSTMNVANGSLAGSGAGHSSMPVIKNSIKLCRRRKARTVFSDQQLNGLEKRFESQKYLSTPERVELANSLGLSETQVSCFFTFLLFILFARCCSGRTARGRF